MIIMRLMGGLGNQMFQYALGRRLAIEREVPLKIYLDWYQGRKERSFELDQMHIHAETASQDDFFKMKYYSHNRLVRQVHKLHQFLMPYYRKRYVFERKTGEFDPNILNVPKNAQLIGYWQTERYFEPIKNIIQEELTTPLNQFPPSLQNVIGEIQANESAVSVHIRRGDYLQIPGFLVLPLTYYKKAISHIKQYVPSPHFYVFSDDVEWVQNNFIFDEPASFVNPEEGGRAYPDMYLMSQCRHHIIANSSFSWWGAWLGESSDSMIIAPKQWFTQKPYPKDTVPDRWIKL